MSQSAARATRHYSTYENVKLNSGDVRRVYPNVGTRNINRNSSFVTSVERHPRSYAEMIADYSEMLYKGSAVSARNDRLRFNDAIRKEGPFGTSSILPLRGGVSSAVRKNDLPSCAFTLANAFKSRVRRDEANDVEGGAFERDDTLVIESTNKNGNRIATSDSKSEADQSYAKSVIDCGRSAHNIPLASVPNGGGLASRRNVLTRNSLESFATPTRGVSSTKARETLHKPASAIAAMPIERSVERQMADKTDGIKKSKRNASTRKNNYSQLCNTTSHPPRYFSGTARRRTRPGAPARKNSTQMITSGSASKRSQVELRMMPSEKESVVSVNVDSALSESANLLDPVTKELSVVVQSDRKRDAQSAEAQQSVSTFRQSARSASQRRADFGPMHISISEDSAPVKQIEFSVNGKPVSELRSITARTERLDVVSTVDKVEIRIPFAKDDATGKISESDLSGRIEAGTEQVLNVQIFANFQDRPAKGSTERPYKAKATDTAPMSPQTPKTHYVFKDSGKVRSTSSDGIDARRYESDGMDAESDEIVEENMNKDEIVNDVDLKIQPETESKLPADDRITGISSIVSTGDLDIGRLNANDVMDTLRSTEANKYDKNETSNSRVPSKMVPWWSSSDCFSKIRKKEGDRKPVATSNINKKKASSRRNLTAGSVLSRTKETSSSSGILPKSAQPVNNTIITTNTGNPISHSNSLEQREESAPPVHYPCLFRLKSDRENLGAISEMVKNAPKIENGRTTSATKVSDERISETRWTGSVGLSTSETTSIQGERDASVEPDRHVEKASVLPEKFNVPTGERDLPFKKNREEEHDDLLNQTKSIDGMSSSKSRIKNILNAIKPIEKKEDGTLIDYGLKMPSRKPTVAVNSRVYRLEDPFSAAGTKPREDSRDERRFEIKISKEEKEEDVKNIATPAIKVQNEDNVKNKTLEQPCQSDVKISTDLERSLELTQATNKREKTADDTIVYQNDLKQSLKSPEPNRDITNLLGINTSSKTKNSEKLGLPKELKQSRPKTLSVIETALGRMEIHGSEKLRNSESSELQDIRHLSRESVNNRKMVDRKRSPLAAVNEMQVKSVKTDKSSSQTRPDLISKIKNDTTRKKPIKKNAGITSITQRSADRPRKRTDVENVTAKIATRRSAGEDSSSENREESRPRESKPDKVGGNSFAGSTDPPRKPSGAAGFKSFSSQTRTRSGIKSNESCTYARKLLFTGSSYVSFDRKDATLSNLRPAVFNSQRNHRLDNIDGASEDRASGVTGNAAPWTDMDRPEKGILYSAWLHRFRNDVNNNERLF